MFEAMKLVSVLQRAYRTNMNVMPPEQVLGMTTINGAKALGLQDEIGSIVLRKKADIIVIDLKKMKLTPLELGKHINIYSHLVYATHGDDVNTVIVDGRIVMRRRKLLQAQESEIIETTQAAYETVIHRLDEK